MVFSECIDPGSHGDPPAKNTDFKLHLNKRITSQVTFQLNVKGYLNVLESCYETEENFSNPAIFTFVFSENRFNQCHYV